jgi:hypothetical protein
LRAQDDEKRAALNIVNNLVPSTLRFNTTPNTGDPKTNTLLDCEWRCDLTDGERGCIHTKHNA